MKHCFNIVTTAPPSKEYCANYDKVDWRDGRWPIDNIADNIPINSRVIVSLGYDPKRKELHVKQQNNDKLKFYSVPRETYDALISSPDIDSYYFSEIRSKHAFMRLTTRLQRTV